MVRIVAVAGRNGSGKSTVLDELRACCRVSNISKTMSAFKGNLRSFIAYVLFDRPAVAQLNYIIDKIFEAAFTPSGQAQLSELGQKHKYHPEYEALMNLPYQVNLDAPPLNYADGFIELNFSRALKRIMAQLLRVPYALLSGDSTESRKWRETEVLDVPVNGKKVNARQALEYIGTEAARGYRADVWLIAWCVEYKRILANSNDCIVGVADLRYENEFEYLSQQQAMCIVVYRTDMDLVLTEEDKKTHSSRWSFLLFNKKCRCIANKGTKEDLRQNIKTLYKELITRI